MERQLDRLAVMKTIIGASLVIAFLVIAVAYEWR